MREQNIDILTFSYRPLSCWVCVDDQEMFILFRLLLWRPLPFRKSGWRSRVKRTTWQRKEKSSSTPNPLLSPSYRLTSPYTHLAKPVCRKGNWGVLSQDTHLNETLYLSTVNHITRLFLQCFSGWSLWIQSSFQLMKRWGRENPSIHDNQTEQNPSSSW